VRDSNVWDEDYETYTDSQVEYALRTAGISIDSETYTHFLVYCPYHNNMHSPAMAVDKEKGLFTCFNPACEASGTLITLIQHAKGCNYFQAHRIISKGKTEEVQPFHERVIAALEHPPEFIEFPQSTLDKAYESFPGSVAESYMMGRGFEHDTLDYFQIGYSAKKNMVVVPMHDPHGLPVGLIGRTPSKDDKRFKNSMGLPKSLTAWNFHRAKKTGDTVIIVEAAFDAMKVHQAGFPNVIALLGGHLSDHHVRLIGKHFTTIINMTDMDPTLEYKANCRKCKHIQFAHGDVPCIGHRAGRELGRQIATKLSHKNVLWAVYDDDTVYPNGAKDATDMTDQEINQCLRNAVPHVLYELENYEQRVA
jgi:hypothetical protein